MWDYRDKECTYLNLDVRHENSVATAEGSVRTKRVSIRRLKRNKTKNVEEFSDKSTEIQQRRVALGWFLR